MDAAGHSLRAFLSPKINSLDKALTAHTTLREEAIHIFRALLRESTYLPDQAARDVIRRQISLKFRKDRWKRRRTVDPQRRPLAEQSIRPSLKGAQDALRYLQRANAGHTRQLSSILSMTYGRTRDRRHELLLALKSPPPSDRPSDSDSIDLADRSDSDWGSANISPPLDALIRSQAKRDGSAQPRGSLRLVAPEVPDQNAWCRPLPLKRVENIEKRWLAESLHRVMPPLPADEWERLRRLASGEGVWSGAVPRRKGRVADVMDAGASSHMTEAGISRPHALTPRYMRRLWSNVLSQCPKLEMEGTKSGWKVEWADVENQRDVGLKAKTTLNMAMFRGVNSKGKMVA